MPCPNCHCSDCLTWREQQVIQRTRSTSDPVPAEAVTDHVNHLREIHRNANRPKENRA